MKTDTQQNILKSLSLMAGSIRYMMLQKMVYLQRHLTMRLIQLGMKIYIKFLLMLVTSLQKLNMKMKSANQLMKRLVQKQMQEIKKDNYGNTL